MIFACLYKVSTGRHLRWKVLPTFLASGNEASSVRQGFGIGLFVLNYNLQRTSSGNSIIHDPSTEEGLKEFHASSWRARAHASARAHEHTHIHTHEYPTITTRTHTHTTHSTNKPYHGTSGYSRTALLHCSSQHRT